MRAILLILLCAVSVLADGVNKPKRKPKRKAVTQATKVVVTPKAHPIKPPALLTTKYDVLLNYPFLRPLRPLNDIPPVKPEVITTREVAQYPFEESRKPKFWFLLIGAAAIPFLVPHGDNPQPIAFVPPEITPFINPTTGPTPSSSPGSSPTPTPEAEPRGGPPPTTVPEPTSIILFVSGLAILLKRRVSGHLIKRELV